MAKQNKTSSKQTKAANSAAGSPFGPGSFGGIPNAQARSGKFQTSGGFQNGHRGKNTPANWRRFNP